MAMKISIKFSWPIRFERIRNGEKVIVQSGPDEAEAEIREGEVKGKSPIVLLHKLLDEGKKEISKKRNRKGTRHEFQSRRSLRRHTPNDNSKRAGEGASGTRTIKTQGSLDEEG